MKPAQIFYQYIWIINTFRTYRKLTLDELNQKWINDDVANGNPLQRSSFNRHRDAIQDMFGIIIDCEPKTYKYFIGNQEVLSDDSISQWLFSTLNVHGVLADSAAVKERLVLEETPAGEQYLDTIIRAIKSNHRLLMGYKKFEAEGYERVVCPYALKLFHQRWYLLALLPADQGQQREGDQMRLYALDRMTRVQQTGEPFEMPADFSAQTYFSEYFGVLTDNTPMAHVVVRAHKWMPNYLRTLPLHHSQRELEGTPDYTDFSYDLRPTSDFLGELLRHSDGIEVLQPPNLREKMRQMIAETLKRY
jgi:predicted DNA-binding transcriptional regulator YafY